MIYLKTGNLFTSDADILCHQVNCKGAMGAGIAVEAKKRFPGMLQEYKDRCERFGVKNLGQVHFYVTKDKVLANLFGQFGYGVGHYTNEAALKNCMEEVRRFARFYNLSVGFPEKIGCGLGGADWNVVEKMIKEVFGGEDKPDCYIVKYAPEKNKTDESQAIEIYTDGSCSGNPGPGGWGVILLSGEASRKLSGGEALTTNNRMELTAAIQGLSALKRPCKVTLYSDSTYLVNAIEKGWLANWKKTNWKRGTVKNQDLWKELDKLLEIHKVKFVWVKGHAENPYNEICDEMAVSETKKFL